MADDPWPDGGARHARAMRAPDRGRRRERTLWVLVVGIAVLGAVLVGALRTGGPEPGLPTSTDGGTDVSVAQPPGRGEAQPPGRGEAQRTVPAAPPLLAPAGAQPSEPAGAPPRSPPSGSPPSDGMLDREGASSPARSDDVHSRSDLPHDDPALSGTSGHGPRADGGPDPPLGDGGATATAPSGWSEAARGFGLAFTRTAAGQDAWFSAMSSWLTPEQAERYRNVPVSAIPIGGLRDIDVVDPGSARHARGRLTYDTGMVLEVGLSYLESAGGWLVARVTLAETDTSSPDRERR